MTTLYDLPIPENAALARSEALSEHIRQALAKQGGKLSFAAFMELALYYPKLGYYNAKTFNLGKQGDFTTAPEISPLFAKCFAPSLSLIFEQLGSSNILEIGAGTGRFANDLLLALNHLGYLPAHYYIYEISAELRKKQQAYLQSTCPAWFSRIHWLSHLPERFKGVVIANEVLDALPVHCFRCEEEGVKERFVIWENEQFAWHVANSTTPGLTEEAQKIRECYALPAGYQSEINLSLPPFIHSLANTLAEGVILLADYGYGREEYYRPERSQGSLTCFYQHRRHDNPLILVGLQDITAHVDFTRVIESAAESGCSLLGYTSQAAFLLACGILDIAQEEEQTLSPGSEFELHQAIKQLTLPTEMGERIKIMALGKNCDLSLPGFGLQDRTRDL